MHIKTGSPEKARRALETGDRLVLSEADMRRVLSGEKTLEQAREASVAPAAVGLRADESAQGTSQIASPGGVDLGWGILYDPSKKAGGARQLDSV